MKPSETSFHSFLHFFHKKLPANARFNMFKSKLGSEILD